MLQVQLVDAAHQGQVALAHRAGPVVRGAPADVEQPGLALHRKLVVAVDHLLALSPALVIAPLEKSISSACCPILACSTFTSTLDAVAAGAPPEPNTSAARSSSCRRHSVTCVDFELLGDLGDRLVVLHRRQGHFGLEPG